MKEIKLETIISRVRLNLILFVILIPNLLSISKIVNNCDDILLIRKGFFVEKKFKNL